VGWEPGSAAIADIYPPLSYSSTPVYEYNTDEHDTIIKRCPRRRKHGGGDTRSCRPRSFVVWQAPQSINGVQQLWRLPDFWLGSNGVTPASSEMKEVSGDLDPRLLFVSLFDESFRPGLIELTDTLVANGESGLDGMRGWAVDGRLDLLPKGSREAEIFERSGRVVSCGLS
jgi:hypothetical protein